VTIVRIPADVDLEDRLIGRLTARQVVILAAALLAVWTGWTLGGQTLPLPVFAVAAVLVGLLAVLVAFARRDGLTFDQFALAVARQHLGSRPARPPLAAAGVPGWVTGPASRAPHPPGSATRIPTTAATGHGIPHGHITGADAGTGVIDLGGLGLVVIAVCSSVQLAWLDERDQARTLATLAGYLHSLTGPVQLVARAVPVDLSGHTDTVARAAAALPAALADAAADHARFLSDLTTGSGLLRREILLVLREPRRPGPTTDQRSTGWFGRRARRARPVALAGGGAEGGADARLARRLAEAADLLGAAGITVSPLDPTSVAAVLTAAANPARRVPGPPTDPDQVITAITAAITAARR
jgi:hypothetical protein